MEKVLISTLVRDRDWVLPSFLDKISNIDYQKKMLTLAFLVNDSTDNSFNLINQFQIKNIDYYANIKLITNNHNAPKDEQPNGERDGTVRGNFLYDRLAKLRNIMISTFLKTNCDYYLSVDSDILVKRNILKELIKLNTPMASAIISNDLGKGVYGNIMNYTGSGHFKHIDLRTITKDIIQCDMSGACILFRRDILENKSFRYVFHSLGEDVGLHLKTMNAGFKILAKRGLARHIMREGMLK